MTSAEAKAAADSRAASDQSADQQTAYYQNQAALGQGVGYPGSPQYGPSGVMPKRDGGLERYISHNLGITHWSDNNEEAAKAVNGPYQGMMKNAAIEKMNDEYRKMSPENRAVYERQMFNQDQRSPAELKSQGFQYQDQTAAYGDKSPLNNPASTNPTYGQPSAQDFSDSAGAMTPDTSKGAKRNSASDLMGDTPQLPGSTPPANTDNSSENRPIPTAFNAMGTVATRPSGGAIMPATRPSGGAIMPAATSVVPHPEMAVAPVGGVAAESPGVQAKSNPSGAPIVSNGGFTSTNPDFRVATGMETSQPKMGDPNDTARFGPRYTGSGSLNAVDTAARNEMATKAFADSQAGVKPVGTAQPPSYAAPTGTPAIAQQNPNLPIGTNSTTPLSLPQPAEPIAAAPSPVTPPAPLAPPSTAQALGQTIGSIPGQATSNMGAGIGRIGQAVAPVVAEAQAGAETAEEITKRKAAQVASGVGKVYNAVATPITNATAATVTGVNDFTKGFSQGMKAPTYSAGPTPSPIPNPPPAYASVK